ncbi:MAG TPA: PEP-CTERM sorting domain-containing protein, partial [Pirellulales bacterium]|nr:PEP-CTERM sorting domain-containing protein [Pirellulales bacterium]
SGTATIGAGVTATVNSGATLELAGSVSALSAGANRVSIINNSQVAGGGLLVSGTNQQVGNIDGSGNVTVNAGANLTANHIVQNALLIGGAAGNPANVTIDASDASGNPLDTARGGPLTMASSGFIIADSLAQCAPFGAGPALSADPIAAVNLSASVDAPAAMKVSTADPLASLNSVDDSSAVPEPASCGLLTLGGLALLLFTRSKRRRAWGWKREKGKGTFFYHEK